MEQFIVGRESFPIAMDAVVDLIHSQTNNLPSKILLAGVNVVGDIVLHYEIAEYAPVPSAPEVVDTVGEVANPETN